MNAAPDDSGPLDPPAAEVLAPRTDAFSLLAPGVQRRLWDMRWTQLRPIQADAIRAYADSSNHLVVMAETAGGKTEAAFLPVLSAISTDPPGSVRAVYVGPLKALINDQFQRLESLCKHLELPVYRWHGDVPASQKKRLIKEPAGILLITPESIESLLINRTSALRTIFGGLRAIVIDELHSFLEGERGLHLASLLSRVHRYIATDQPAPRLIGLSATIGDPGAACRYLSPNDPAMVTIIRDPAEAKEIQLRVHAFETQRPGSGGTRRDSNDDSPHLDDIRRIALELVERCRGTSNLVFANVKGDIELLADAANAECRAAGLPEEFLVHHGSLSKEIREDTETTMKSDRPHTTICSSTLEMGIDIGSVRMVGQVGAPWSVASLKQRMGRSGRRDDEPRRLRVFARVPDPAGATDALAAMPLELLQSLAVIDLMLEGWVEPPDPAKCDLSTLTHQVVSVIAETGGTSPKDLYVRLCKDGPFRSIEPKLFAEVLRTLVTASVLEETSEGGMILGTPIGEDIRASKDFYAAFQTPEEFKVVHEERAIGLLPARFVPEEGQHVVLAGRRWLVVDVDPRRREIQVRPAHGAKKPLFMSGGGEVHPRIRERMREILASNQEFAYLAPGGKTALDSARRVAHDTGLCERAFVATGQQTTLWMTWTGTKAQRTLVAALRLQEVVCTDRLAGIECRVSAQQLRSVVRSLATQFPEAAALAKGVVPKACRKFDDLLPEQLLDVAIARDRVDAARAAAVCRDVNGNDERTLASH